MTNTPPSADGETAGAGTPKVADTSTPHTTRQQLPEAYLHTYLGRFDAKLLGHPAAGRVIAAFLLIVLIIPCVQFVITIQKVDSSPFRETGQRNRTALGRWLPTAGELTEGEGGDNPYGYGHWFPTPPLVLISLVPLYKLGFVGAGVIWAGLKVAGLALAAALLLREMRRKGMAVPLGVLLMTVAFSIRPIISDIQHGNLNIFMMVWIALAWVAYLRGRDAACGLLLALAVVTKITPALLLVYFLYKREWRVCGWALIGLLLAFIIIPGAILGFETNALYLRTWFDMLVRPFALQGYASLEIANQSLFGVLQRLLSNAGILNIVHMPTEEAMLAGMEEMARPASPIGRMLRPMLSLIVVGLLAWACRPRRLARGDAARMLELGLVLIAMLLLSERTWKHHATTLPLVYLGIWYVLTCLSWSDRARGWLVAGLAVQFALLVLGEGILGKKLGDRALDGGIFCWGLLVCFAQLLIMLRCMPDRSKATPASANETARG